MPPRNLKQQPNEKWLNWKPADRISLLQLIFFYYHRPYFNKTAVSFAPPGGGGAVSSFPTAIHRQKQKYSVLICSAFMAFDAVKMASGSWSYQSKSCVTMFSNMLCSHSPAATAARLTFTSNNNENNLIYVSWRSKLDLIVVWMRRVLLAFGECRCRWAMNATYPLLLLNIQLRRRQLNSCPISSNFSVTKFFYVASNKEGLVGCAASEAPPHRVCFRFNFSSF